jgi:NADH-quinone oxidoreductase subunit K
MTAGLAQLLILSAVVFGLGCFGLVARRSLMHVLLNAALMLMAPIILVLGVAGLGPGKGGGSGAALAIVAAVALAAQLGVGMVLVLFKSRPRTTAAADELDVLDP